MTKAKFLVLLLAVTILLLVFPNIVSAATVQATETTTTSTGKTVNWSYELDSNNNIIDLKCTNISAIGGDLTIPSTIDGHTVLTIGNTKNGYDDGAFENCPGITGITIPNTVTTIGYRAFYNCTGLKTVTLPNSVNGLGEGVFYGCTGLTSITFSNSLSSIGSYAFENCTGLKSVSFPSSLTKIADGAFENCTGISEIVIPDNVTTVGGRAFQGCKGLKNVTLSKNMTKINNMTFRDCSGLTSVIIPESVTTIEGGYSWQGSFGGCTNLEKILIPDSVATIGENAFEDCNKLTIYGNDGQTSKSFAEQYSINFKYISQWDESDVGDDITPPYVESILVPYSSVSSYYDSNSTTYIVPSRKVLIINVNFNESILATEVPSLTIKFGSGSNIVLTEGTVSGSTVAYTYTIASGDIGTMTVVSLAGGNITDEAGNEAILSCPELKVQYWNHYIYANGTAIDPDNGDNPNNGSTNNGTTNNGSTNNGSTSTKNDTTTAPGKIPHAGVGIGIVLGIIAVIIAGVVVYSRYKKMSDI